MQSYSRADIEPILKEIVATLVRDYQPEAIILYGSYAYGTPTRHSDIDLLIVARTDLSPEDRFILASRALRGLGYAFDLIVKTPTEYERWRKVVNHIVYYADRYGRIIYQQ